MRLNLLDLNLWGEIMLDKLKPIMPPNDLKNVVSFHEQKNLNETWKWIAEADILLLLEFHFSKGIFFYAKLSDYLHTSRPILSLSPKEGCCRSF